MGSRFSPRAPQRRPYSPDPPQDLAGAQAGLGAWGGIEHVLSPLVRLLNAETATLIPWFESPVGGVCPWAGPSYVLGEGREGGVEAVGGLLGDGAEGVESGEGDHGVRVECLYGGVVAVGADDDVAG